MQCKFSDGTIMIGGFLAKDAEYMQVGGDNKSLTKFSVKVGERPPQNGEQRGVAIWCNCECWRSVARAAMGLKKFDVVIAFGKLKVETYTKDGEEKQKKVLVCEGVFVQPPAAPAPAPMAQGAYIPPADSGMEIFDEDGVPF